MTAHAKRPGRGRRKVYRKTAVGYILYGVGPVPFKQCSRCQEPREPGRDMCAAHRRETQNQRNEARRGG